MARLIVTNGEAAVAQLRAAGIEDEVLAWNDVLHDGPVPAGLALEALSARRAKFLADDLGLPLEKVTDDFRQRDARLRAHAEFDRIELWFEHDLYDQLQLIQLLDFFDGEDRSEGVLLVQADDYLGLQGPAAIAALEGEAKSLTADQSLCARTAWRAFTAPIPLQVAQIALSSGDELPCVRPALLRLLAELPAPKGGLSLSEWRTLACLAAGARTVAALFKTVSEQDQARFLGDAAFFRRLDGLAFASFPVVEGLPFASPACAGSQDRYRAYARAEVRLTDVGRAALCGRFDHARENAIDRWCGGVHLTQDALWRWEPVNRALVTPG